MQGWRICMLLLAVAAAGPARAAPGDHVHIFGRGHDGGGSVSIDLNSGVVIAEAWLRRPDGEVAASEKRVLGPAELTTLKDALRRLLKEGLRSKACDDSDLAAARAGRPAPLHLIVSANQSSAEFQIDGRELSQGSNEGCDGPGVEKLGRLAYALAPHVEVPSGALSLPALAQPKHGAASPP